MSQDRHCLTWDTLSDPAHSLSGSSDTWPAGQPAVRPTTTSMDGCVWPYKPLKRRQIVTVVWNVDACTILPQLLLLLLLLLRLLLRLLLLLHGHGVGEKVSWESPTSN